MRILITGGTGFIGKNLIRHVLKTQPSDMVYSLQRETGTALSARHILVPCNLSDANAPLPAEGVDVVVHLAQSRHYREFPGQANDIYSINVDSTFRLAEWARQHGVKKFIFASTGSVYKTSEEPLKETDAVLASNFYSASKLAAENLLHPYGNYFSVDIVRIFSPYGPGQANMLIPNMIQRIRDGQEITLAGGKGLVMSPLYIDDCTEVLRRLFAIAGTGTNIYNLGGSETASLYEIILHISADLGIEPKLKGTDDDFLNISADSSRIYELVNYHPVTGLIDGLKKCLR